MNRRSFMSFLGAAPIGITAAIAAPATPGSVSCGPTRLGFKAEKYEIDPRAWGGPEEYFRAILAEENKKLAGRVRAVLRDPRSR